MYMFNIHDWGCASPYGVGVRNDRKTFFSIYAV